MKLASRVLRASAAGLAVALAAFALVQVPAARAGTIVGSKHDIPYDLSLGSALMRMEMNDYGEICVYCHTPHQANTASYAGVPLWNRSTDTSSFTMYDSATIDTTLPTTPNSYSLICLSCHDGSLAVDSIVNAPGSGYATSGPWYGKAAAPLHYQLKAGAGNCGECHTGGIAHDQDAVYIGTNLSDDHPVGMTYPTAMEDAAFNLPPDLDKGWTGSIKLYNGRVECPSCHNVHDPTVRPFLRESNAQSALCKVCHIK